MASAKSELSTAPNVQNVVVYVSNDNFAQAYAVNHQNVPHSQQSIQHGGGYTSANHSMASLVKSFSEKQAPQIVNSSQGGYFANVISQNSFQQPIVNNVGYQNVHNGGLLKNYLNNDVISSKVREECDINRDSNYVEQPYVILGPEVAPQNVRCDSVRSETAESSCSSLSSSEEGMLVVQNRSPDNSNMVVYDPSVSVRQGGVVLTAVGPTIGSHQTTMGPSLGSHQPAVGPPIVPHQVAVGPPVGPHHVPQNQNILVTPSVQAPQFVTVPNGWKRLVNNGSVIYIRSIAGRFDMPKSTLHKCFKRVVRALNDLAPEIIKWPNAEERTEIKKGFSKWAKISGVVGAIDGTYVPIKAPQEHPETYINRKCFHAITLQAICDHKRRFIDVFAGYPSSVGDLRIFKNSHIFSNISASPEKYFTDKEYIIGDKAYPILKWCIPPYIDRGNLRQRETNFNTCHAKTRQTVERSFALLFGRFRRLKYLDMSNTDVIPSVILAACVLHNICLMFTDNLLNLYTEEGAVNVVTDEDNNRQNHRDDATTREEGLQLRDEIANMLATNF